MASDYSEWDLNVDVPEGVFERNRAAYPSVGWFAKIGGQDRMGYFFTDPGNLPDTPAGWKEKELYLGNSGEPGSFLVTHGLEMIPIGVRQRYSITDSGDRQHFFPMYTKRPDGLEGRFISHTQVMFVTPDFLTTPLVLGLNGITKTQSWTNNRGTKGVWELLAEWVGGVEKATGKSGLPNLCMWRIRLTPAYKEGKPHIINQNGSQVNPFTLDLDKVKPSYVGPDVYAQLRDLRVGVVMAWEQEWKTASVREDSYASNEWSEPVAQPEEDDIPF